MSKQLEHDLQQFKKIQQI